ncbi:MAG: hypothetical protein SVO01_00480 [Thermotogota bacterium]|nr:hypothetical protein [Thermotogota bacterium]
MATGKKVWKGEATIKSTDGYGGGDADLAADEAWDFSGDIDLETNGYEGALIYLEHDSSGTTDNIILGIFPSVDGTDRATNPLRQIEYDATGGVDTQEPPVKVFDLQHFEIGVKTSGTTDTFDYRIRWDAWRWDVS